ALRRRPHGLVPLLRRARRSRRASAWSLPARRRLVRGLDARLLEAVRRDARRDRGLARGRERRPGLRLRILGDGPDRPRLQRLVGALGLDGAVELPGKVAEEEVAASMARAAVVATASEREGYGL